MTPTHLLLTDRREEFDQHWSVVTFLEARSGESLGIAGGGNLERRHVAISKAGLLVHLYNIVEAVMSHQLGQVMKELSGHNPANYNTKVLKEWVRQQAGTHTLMGEDTRLSKSISMSEILLDRAPVQIVGAPNASGNWDDEKIDKVADRLGCPISVGKTVRKAARSPYFNGKSRMYYVKKKRNDLAHGVITFEDGGRDKTLLEIREIANATLDYLDAVVVSFSSYLSSHDFLVDAKP